MSRKMACPATGKDVFFSLDHIDRAIKHGAEHKVYLIGYKCKHCGFLHTSRRRKKKGKDEVIR